MNEYGKLRVLTSAVADYDGPLIPGTTVRPCAECGRDCYVAPSSRPPLEAGALVTCGPCAIILASGGHERITFGITTEALDELADLARAPGHNRRSRKGDSGG